MDIKLSFDQYEADSVRYTNVIGKELGLQITSHKLQQSHEEVLMNACNMLLEKIVALQKEGVVGPPSKSVKKLYKGSKLKANPAVVNWEVIFDPHGAQQQPPYNTPDPIDDGF